MDYGAIVFGFVGGLGLFLYGMHVMAEGLQKTAGSSMKRLLESLTKSKFRGVLVGAAVTAVIQSSSATTVMVVGFVNAGLMNLTQSVGVIMGANIGTTITAWLIATDELTSRINVGGIVKYLTPTSLSPGLIALGAAMIVFSKKERIRHIGEIVVGFGILFLGMNSMTQAAAPLRSSETFRKMFVSFGTNPFLGILVGAVVTGIIQSSSASVGILQSLAAIGMVPWNAAVYIIMGQNIGTCVTAIISSIGASKTAKSAAYIHLCFNVIGSVVFGFLAILFFYFISPAVGMHMIDMTGISMAHTAFNIANTALLYPFSKGLIFLAQKMANVSEADVDESMPVHLDDRMLETPAFALECCMKEIIRLANMCMDNFQLSIKALMEKNEELADKVFKREKKIDALEQAITGYLVKIAGMGRDNDSSRIAASLFHTVSDVERVGDHAENIAELAKYFIGEKLSFSEGAVEELNEIINLTINCYSKSIAALESNNTSAAEAVLLDEEIIDVMSKSFRTGHINRLTNNECNSRTGVVFLDTLTNLERISDHAENIAESVLELKKN